MGRPLRIEYPGALYHVTSRGNERRDIFLDDSDRRKFLDILEDYYDRYGILTHCYVVMDNHYHVVVETPQGNLLKVMHGIRDISTANMVEQDICFRADIKQYLLKRMPICWS